MDDCFAFLAPWGFDVATDIKAPVFLYQGSEDLMVPFSQYVYEWSLLTLRKYDTNLIVTSGEWLGSHINPRYITKHLEQGEGHISVMLGRIDGMLDELRSVIDRKAQ